MTEAAPDALPGGHSIDVVRGRIDDRLANELVDFWTAHNALDAASARKRVDEVVCVLRRPDGGIAAVNSPYRDRVEALGGRLLWVYRSFAPSDAAQAAFEPMFAAAAESLGADYAGGGETPWGLCYTGPAPSTAAAEDVRWPASGLMLAGFTAAGEQIRVRYFDDPTAPSEYPLKHRLLDRAASRAAAIEDQRIIDLWTAEGALPPAEAERRVAEVCMVGLSPAGELAGLSTAYLARQRAPALADVARPHLRRLRPPDGTAGRPTSASPPAST